MELSKTFPLDNNKTIELPSDKAYYHAQYSIMFARQVIRNTARSAAKRSFHTSKAQAVHFEEGVYSNLPFKVHNRRIPFAFLHFGFFGLAFAIPFIAVGVQLKRSGAF